MAEAGGRRLSQTVHLYLHFNPLTATACSAGMRRSVTWIKVWLRRQRHHVCLLFELLATECHRSSRLPLLAAYLLRAPCSWLPQEPLAGCSMHATGRRERRSL